MALVGASPLPQGPPGRVLRLVLLLALGTTLLVAGLALAGDHDPHPARSLTIDARERIPLQETGEVNGTYRSAYYVPYSFHRVELWTDGSFDRVGYTGAFGWYEFHVSFEAVGPHTVQVRATETGAFETRSEEVRVYGVEPPTAARNLSASHAYPDGHMWDEINLTWDPPSYDGYGIVSYDVQRWDPTDGEWDTVASTEPHATHAIVRGTVQENETFRVLAKNGAGTGPPSGNTSFTIPPLPEATNLTTDIVLFEVCEDRCYTVSPESTIGVDVKAEVAPIFEGSLFNGTDPVPRVPVDGETDKNGNVTAYTSEEGHYRERFPWTWVYPPYPGGCMKVWWDLTATYKDLDATDSTYLEVCRS